MGQWKAVRLPAFTGELELYDLTQDVGETRNVADEHPDVVAKALAAMQQAHTPSPRWQVKGRPAKRKKL
jgi:arylsulfatase A-like enzyme